MPEYHSYVTKSIVSCVSTPSGSVALEVSNPHTQGILLIEVLDSDEVSLRVSLWRRKRHTLRTVTELFPEVIIDTYDTLFRKKESGCRQLERSLRPFTAAILKATKQVADRIPA